MKITMLGCVAMLAVGLPVGAEPTEAPGKTETSKTKKKPMKIGKITFEGGDGSSFEEAVVIKGAKDTMEGIEAESKWMEKKHRGWEKGDQALVSKDGKHYDRIDYSKPKDGKKMTIFFDITDFYGK